MKSKPNLYGARVTLNFKKLDLVPLLIVASQCSGYFVGNEAGRALSSAKAFSGNRVPVMARFSVGGGNPKASYKGRSVRGLALQFNLPNSESWLMANVSAPVFFFAKPEQFAPFLLARTPDPATGKPDPEKLKAFNEANPETTL